jgi:GAF domain-containing protein
MVVSDKVDIRLFKVVTRAISESEDLDTMAQQLTQLLVATLGLKGATLFLINFETDELEAVASSGLSAAYLNKGPVLVRQSIYKQTKGQPVVISDLTETDLLQYPQDARKEGIQAIVSLPIQLSGRMVVLYGFIIMKPGRCPIMI